MPYKKIYSTWSGVIEVQEAVQRKIFAGAIAYLWAESNEKVILINAKATKELFSFRFTRFEIAFSEI